MGLNMGGNSFGSRLLYGSIQRKFFKKQPETFEKLMQNLANQLLQLQKGFQFEGQTWHIITLGLKGDLPWFTKAASLTRHFLRAQRLETTKSKAAPPAGICFLCHAGRCGVPYEDFGDHAKWLTSGCDVPWMSTPSLLQLFHDEDYPTFFYKPDVWHNFHGGCGKDFVASAMTEALVLVPGSSKEAKIQSMSEIMKEWGQQSRHRRPHSGDFCADRIGLTSYQVCPEACWSKHNDTTIYMRFLQFFLHSHLGELRGNAQLDLVYRATCAMNLCWELLYECGLWLPKEIALQAVSLGRFWLQAYSVLARMAFNDGKLRFPLHSKLHYLDHTWRHMQDQACRSDWVYNCLNESVQIDEAGC